MCDSENVRETASNWVERLRDVIPTRLARERLVVYDGVVLDVGAPFVGEQVHRAMADGWYERREATLVRRHLPPDVDVIELGAGIGYVSTIIDTQLDRDRTHVAVEPNPAVVPTLEKTKALNDGRWAVQDSAYHSTAESVELDRSDDYWSATTAGSTSRTIDVPATSLSRLCAQHGLSTFALVLDVEGAEYDLFVNELDLLEARCSLVVVEFHEDGPAADEYDDHLVDAGFELLGGWDDVCAYRNPDLDG